MHESKSKWYRPVVHHCTVKAGTFELKKCNWEEKKQETSECKSRTTKLSASDGTYLIKEKNILPVRFHSNIPSRGFIYMKYPISHESKITSSLKKQYNILGQKQKIRRLRNKDNADGWHPLSLI